MENKSVYEAYGRYAVQFEKACGSLEVLIDKILLKEGLKKKEMRDIILSGLTAEPLKSLAQSLIGELLKPRDEEAKIIKSIFSQFHDLATKRNEIIHARLAAWSISHGDEYKEYMTGYKLHKNSGGVAIKQIKHTCESLQENIEDARRVFYSICQLRKCIEDGLSIRAHFSINKHGKYQTIGITRQQT